MADTEKEIILHTKYRFKPENSTDKYVTMHFETGSGDVIIDTNIEGAAEAGVTTLTDLVQALIEMIQKCATKPVYDTSKSLAKKDLVLARGQFGIESDTLKIKIGDGSTPWNYLHYANTSDEDINPDYYQVVTNDDSKIQTHDESGEVTLDLSALRAAYEAPVCAKAYVQILTTGGGSVVPVDGD